MVLCVFSSPLEDTRNTLERILQFMAKPMPPSLEALVTHLTKLPTIGRKSAERLAFHLIQAPSEQSQELANALLQARERLHPCPNCFQITEEDPCPVCRDPERDHRLLCVVENFMDAVALETAGGFRGRYHVLGGCLSPLRGITTQDLTIAALDARIEREQIEEIILAMNPSVDGEATALYLTSRYKARGLRLSRIALGLPMGGDLEHADTQTLQHALQGRTQLS